MSSLSETNDGKPIVLISALDPNRTFAAVSPRVPDSTFNDPGHRKDLIEVDPWNETLLVFLTLDRFHCDFDLCFGSDEFEFVLYVVWHGCRV